ncbi:MAG: 3-deoxy-D-manno-octulosonic acid transferase [Deltaproteobacteria bacterium]|nr:3-deoxy-D-manno-octulosonic acid transferase [Deltaproteobacteria bacterium]TLN03515.1 MAG: 3-deoxy-D-manno-octulosonic acid transferase [bacterium]
MLYLIYDILLFLAVPLYLPFFLFRCATRRRVRKGIAERLGFLAKDKRAHLQGCETLWVHAVSVGETIAARPLLKALKTRYPEKKIVLSTVTETGRSIAEKLSEVDVCIYFPLDFGFAVRRMLKTVHPSLIMVVETEIWPNFLRCAHRSGIRAVLVNGRISDKSFGGYRRFSWVFRQVLANFDALCVQTEEDARRIIAIGAPPARVHVANNLKYDIPVTPVSAESKSSLLGKYCLPSGVPVFTAGSSHRGEDEIVLSVYRTLIREGQETVLVLAPRHPERAEEVAKIAEQNGLRCVRRSQLDGKSVQLHTGEVLLVDTVGELMDIYAISDLVFVGGSLVPVGGHNLLEPASRAVPVIFGPHMNNFREIAALILHHKGGVQVQDSAALMETLRQLLDNSAERLRLGENGLRILTENCGSTERHMEIIASLLSGTGTGGTSRNSPPSVTPEGMVTHEIT